MSAVSFPHIKTMAPWGHARQFAPDPVQFLVKNQKLYGDSFSFRLGSKKVFFFAHPDQVKEVIEKSKIFIKSQTRTSFGESVLTSEGESWKRLRKESQPFFSMKNIDAMVPDIDQITAQLAADLRSDKEIQLHHFLDLAIERILLKIFFGFEQNQGSSLADLTSKIYHLSDQLIKMTLLPFQPKPWMHFGGIAKFYKSMGSFYDLTDDLVARSKSSPQCPYTTFMSVLGQGSQSKDKQHVQLLTFILAGFETTVNGLFWAFLELLKNPEYLDKIREEAKTPTPQTYLEVLNAYPCTKMCLLEAMRLHPPVWFRTRTAAHSAQLAGASIQKNDLVWISQAITHRHPDFWSKPDIFQPERFTDERGFHPYQYWPFSLGKNICQGRDIAMLEMVLLLKNVISECSFDYDKGELANIKGIARVSLRPNQDLRVLIGQSS